MVPMKIVLSLILAMACIGLIAQPVSAATLTHAPMVGAASDTTVNIWIRTVGPASATIQYQFAVGDWSQAQSSGAINLLPENDFTGIISISGLSPGSVYDYRVVLDGVVQSGSTSVFKTLPPT